MEDRECERRDILGLGFRNGGFGKEDEVERASMVFCILFAGTDRRYAPVILNLT